MADLTATTARALRYKLCSASALEAGHARTFLVEGEHVAVFRQRDGVLFATQGYCPHAGGPLADGVFSSGRVVCPLHARKFELSTGKCMEENACLKTYPVTEQDGAIVLEVACA